MKNKTWWMRLIEALTLIFALVALFSPFAAILLPAVLQAISANGQSDLSVSKAWVRPIAVSMAGSDMEGMTMNDSVTAAYMVIENRGGGADKLIGVSTDVASIAEIHQTQIDEMGVARMRPQPEGVEIPSNSTLLIEPLSYHIMLSGLTRTLEREQEITIQLTFASGTVLDIFAIVADFPPE